MRQHRSPRSSIRGDLLPGSFDEYQESFRPTGVQRKLRQWSIPHLPLPEDRSALREMRRNTPEGAFRFSTESPVSDRSGICGIGRHFPLGPWTGQATMHPGPGSTETERSWDAEKMCGIAGVYRSHSSADDRGVVQAMLDRVRHRGPDGEGIFSEGPLCLGHRRLAILDLSEAALQPMVSASGRYVTSFNGEIYDYRELIGELEVDPDSRRT